MKANKSLSATIHWRMIIVTVFSIGMVGSLWIIQEYLDISAHLLKQKNDYIAAKKTEIKTEVDRVIAFIDHKKEITEHQLKTDLKTRVNEAYAVANGIYNTYNGLKSDDEIQKMIKAALRPLIFNNGRGYFFAYDMKGNTVLLPFSPELEGVNLWYHTDSNGEYIIQKTAKMIRQKGQGFLRWHWFKPGQTEQMSEKIGFCKYFEPYDWWIGSGEYIQDFEANVKKEILEWVNEIRFGQDGYIFVYQFDGTILAHFLKESIGENPLKDLTDPYGVKIVGELIHISQESQGDFLEYEGKIRPSTGLRAQKIGYARSIPDWQWSIGAGVYVDAVNKAIEIKHKALIQQIGKDILSLFLIFIFVLVLIGFLLKSLHQKTRDHLSIFTRFFENASSKSLKIDNDSVQFLEFKALAKAANQMVEDRTKAEDALLINEKRLDLALSATNQGIWDWNIKTGEIHFDDRYYTMAGYTPYEFPEAFEEWEKKVHPKDLERVKSAAEAYLAGSVSQFDAEFKFLKKQGSYMWVRGTGKIVARDNQGTPLRFIGTHTDITRQKQDENELKLLRNYLSNIIDSMPSVLVGVDAQGLVTQWNRTVAQTTGISTETARGKKLAQMLPWMAPEMESIAKSIHKSQVIQQEKRPRQTNDVIHYEDITIYPLITNGVEGAVVRIDDVTEKVRMEEMMIQNEKMLSVGGLAAGMAHEINNPLASVIQTTDVMANRLNSINIPANQKAAEAAGITMEAIHAFMVARGIPRMLTAIQESSRRVAEIVDNMLSFARKGETATSSHTLDRLLDKILDLAVTDYDLKKNYDFRKITIKKEYETNLPMVICEGSKIQQVLLNLIRNGAQAMQAAGTPHPTFMFRIYYDKARSMVCVEIEDNGPGMDKTIQKRVFEPFFTTKPIGEGTGLGLSVSYFIITENHGGEMDVDSQPGAGTKFTIRLPARA